MLDYELLARQLTERVYAAAASVQDEWEGHDVPSPSSISYCRRRLWYMAHGVPRSERLPVRSIKKLTTGKLVEPFWLEVYRRAGFTVSILAGGSRIAIPGTDMTGEYDALLTDPVTGLVYLLELKDLGVWSYLDVVDRGVRAGAPEYYAQVQLYMYATGVPVCVFHAGMADASAVYWVWSKVKRRPGRPPDFHLEVIPFDRGEVSLLLERERHLAEVLAGDSLPAPEYDPRSGKYPCGSDENPYCGWRSLCLANAMTNITKEEGND